MKALVEPLPLVPAMCIGLMRSKSAGYCIQSVIAVCPRVTKVAHLVSNLATPLNHFGDSPFVHAPPRLAYRIDNREVGLQRIERRNGGLLAR